jgi:hypothetical protein
LLRAGRSFELRAPCAPRGSMDAAEIDRAIRLQSAEEAPALVHGRTARGRYVEVTDLGSHGRPRFLPAGRVAASGVQR